MILWLTVSVAVADDLGDRLAVRLAPLLAEHRVPAVAVSVVADGRVAFAGGVGVSDAASGDPVTADTRFQIASISKTVAAFTTWRLARDGRIDLDADVRSALVSWQLPDTRFDQAVS